MALTRFHFNIAEHAPQSRAFPARRTLGVEGFEPPALLSDEAAARFHLSRVFEADDRPGIRRMLAFERPGRVPDLRLLDTQELRATGTRLVRFEQVQGSIPVFGSLAAVEMTAARELLSASARVGDVPGSPERGWMSEEEALGRLKEREGVDVGEGPREPGRLNLFERDGRWHLVWLLEDVPGFPPDAPRPERDHGMSGSPRLRHHRVDYLVDAYSGELVFFYSAIPSAAPAPAPIPVRGSGVGEDGLKERLWGQMAGGRYELFDPSRDIVTYDLQGGDIDHAVLSDPVRVASSDLGATHKAMVSAHANSTKVFDFLTSVLQRDSIDNAGMQLVNVVNCVSPGDDTPPEWGNAVWWNERMWYGQAKDAGGTLVSFARFLDILGHELTHGITESSSDLVYKDESGALNESMSDILGIVIKNWYAHPPDGGVAGSWDWEIGPGLGTGGGPLRDMSDPARTGDPAHMSGYLQTTADDGGVHTNSNIHNLAAYNVATARDAAGEPAFLPEEVALLYYHALIRLAKLDGFKQALDAVVDAATAMFAGDHARRDASIAQIRAAYAAVGIT